MHAPRPLRGAIMRRREAGRGAAPAGLVATRHPGGSGAPSGATRVPARSWLTARSAHEMRDGPDESRARCRRRPRLARREAPVPQGTSHKDLRFSARHPPHTPDAQASRQGERMPCFPPRNCPGPRQSLHSDRDQQPGETLLGNAVRQYLPARQRDGPLCRLRSHDRGDRRLGGDERCRAARRHGCPAHADGAARRSKRLDA